MVKNRRYVNRKYGDSRGNRFGGSMNEKISIAIADDLQFSRDFFTMCITYDPHFRLVATFETAEEAA